MITFWLVAALMVGVALLFVLLPLARKQATLSIHDRQAMNAALYRDEFQELESDLQDGSLSQEQYQQAKEELERRVLEDLAVETTPVASAAGKPWILATVAVLLPMLAVLIYLNRGSLEALNPATRAPEVAGAGAHGPTPEQIQAMVAKLEDKLKKNPGDVEGWVMLARTYSALQQFDKALSAFEKAVKLVPDDPNLLADYADVMAMTQGRRLQGTPLELIQRAIKIDPAHQKSLALAGTFEFDRGNYAGAIDYWGRLLRTVPDGSPQAQSIQGGIDEAKAKMGMAPMPQPQVAMASGASVSGTIELGAKLKSSVQAGDTIFIFARAAQGPKMPLAIVKIQAGDLPYRFKLDDTMAMAPNMNLSKFQEVVVGARVSKSGNATPQSGDLEGLSKPVKTGQGNIKVVIDRAIP